MSIAALHQALQQLLERFDLPVYAEDRVPDSAHFPYIVWSSREAPDGEAGSLTVYGWFRHDHTACLQLTDRLLAQLPEHTVTLPFDGGFALLRTEEVSIRADGADTSVEACCMRISLRCYHTMKEEAL